MKRITKLLPAMLACLYISQSCAVFGQAKLQDIIEYALVHSHDVKKSNLQSQEMTYMRKETAAHGLPQVDLTGTYTDMMLGKIEIPESVYAMVEPRYAPLLDQISKIDALYSASAGVQITQLIYSQSYLTGLKTMKKTEELYNLLKTKTEEDILEEIAGVYYQTSALMMQLSTVNKSLSNLKEIHRIADLNYRNDLLKESSVNRLKVTITNLEVNQETLENVIGVQINYLKALAGMPADTTITVDTISVVTGVADINNISAFSTEEVPSYQLLKKQDEINDLQIKSAKSKYIPNIAAFGKFNFSSYNTSPGLDQFKNRNTIGLQLSMPVFTSGINSSKVRQAMLKKSQNEETMLKTRDLLAVGYYNAQSEYNSALRLLNVQKENRELALKVYNQTSLQYNEGMASMADVLNVNSDFLQADNSYNQQVIKCRMSEIKMLKSSGKLRQLVNKNYK
ncbi:MAG TPA: TolC family protein [Bacteroidales bacterium]|nr:TolC family protein [Bacteroidales bacterium]